jgi:alpha-ribazole phosphatase
MTEKTRLYLIRHGEVAGAGVPRYNGHTDVSLSERGVAQYHKLKERFAGTGVTACYTSDLTRCVAGAEIICQRLGIKPVLSPNLRELNIGKWEGKSWTELMAQYPVEWQARLDDIVNYRVPGGENLIDLETRIIPEINGIVERHRGEEALVVAHGGANRIILLNAIGASFSSIFNIEQSYACMNIIDYYADGKTVVTLLNG